ncbi:MAG: peptidylprolyl isomerase, partial [Mangrovicoccus sp.]|nr:peptidylprolyl isomerase [Mangrovicoccus sp.]
MFARFLRQPLLHFCVIGASFFALFSVFGNEPADPRPKGQIIISPQDAHWLAQQFESTWRRPPTAQELNGLIDGFIEEEVYVREALMLGLDQGDTVVRNRLRQKMEFLTEAGAQAANPNEETLRQHYHENAARFTAPARISFMQMLLPEGRDAAEMLAQLKAGRDPAQLSASTLLPTQMTRSPQQAIDGTFGPGMFEALQSVDPG